MAAKVLQSGLYWPTLFNDCYLYVQQCDRCQRMGNISRKHEMPMTNVIEVELFDVWGIDFMVEYVSRWVEAIPSQTNDTQVVMRFLKKNIFTRFGTLRALIRDGGSHFVNKLMSNLLAKYGVKHKVALAYHPQDNGQAEVANREIKQILELEHKAFWAVKKLNLDFKKAGEERLLHLNEMEEFQDKAYENFRIYKERTKRWHDKMIKKREFLPGEPVLLYNSRLKLFPGKLKSRWSGPFVIKKVLNPPGVVELLIKNGETFMVNGQRIKHYFHRGNQEEVTSITLRDP
ncbi:hypothetical protein DH2020_045740 [Rehmannia glutinosa]|uniref:Integrase catalytic domain-containing protein n=1 Tax=Rehmannia glutinosa TaxID=99300 RepID=A0ABR0UDB8_REHGL